MKFQFDPHQPYQLDAIAAVVDLFDGQPRVDFDLSALHAEQAFPNQLHLSPEDLLANLRAIQHRHNLPVDTALKTLPYSSESCLPSREDSRTVYRPPAPAFPNFSLEMETGTGKTYVYLRTALELYRRYGMSKFIVVVPSIAIREGVLKTLDITAEHFRALYHNLPYRYSPYDSGDLNLISQFVQSAAMHILVMTLAAFNKDANVIYQSTDRLQGSVPIHLLQATRPILILDEPQNMGTVRSHAALGALHPLFALSYSATHRDPFNLVYRLTPFRAYQERLVKRIEVAGIEEVDNANRPYLRLIDVVARKRTVMARLAVHRRLAGGAIKEVVVTVRPGDNLEARTNRSDYAAYTVERIDVGMEGGEAAIHFSNGLVLEQGQVAGREQTVIWEQQIAYTIEEHFRKQQRLLQQGIKVLSLFFIDRVDNYVHPESLLRRLFNAAFARIAAQYPDVCRALWGSAAVDPETVQAAYFANRSARSGETVYLDSKTGESQHDKAVYDLIMRNKERLLSLEEPVAFIFSHSALREGWDNPNVFQICTLNQTTSEVKKRQEIGRGIRLAVNQAGARIHDPGVNRLTVVANESYQSYVASLQTEYAEDYGPEGTPPQPTDARARQVVSRVEARYRSADFRRLWERISPRTRYTVRIDSERLIRDVIAALNQAEIRPPRIAIRTAQVQMQDGSLHTLVTDQPAALASAPDVPLPNLVALMEDLLQRATPPLRLSRRTLLDIYRRCDRQQEGLDNPFEFANTAVRLITDRLLEQLVEGIHYERSGAAYAIEQFAPEFAALQAHLVPATRSIYDHVVVESAAEAAFAQALERDPRVRLYVKLPDWFTVPTPLGDHHPGWAIVFTEDDADVRYLVCEVQPAPNRDTRLKAPAPAGISGRRWGAATRLLPQMILTWPEIDIFALKNHYWRNQEKHTPTLLNVLAKLKANPCKICRTKYKQKG